MASRICSILGTLLFVMALALPALAADDDKGKGDEESSDEADSKGDKDADKGDKEEEFVEPDPWERPPPDEEKPAEKEAARLAEKVGDDRQIFLGLLVGLGLETDNKSVYSVSPFGLGFGLNLGYTFDFSMYLGVYYVYYLGNSDTLRANLRSIDTSANYMLTGVEVGYDAWVGPVVLRPSLQLGAAIALSDRTDDPSRTDGAFAFAPGIVVFHPIDEFFIGGDFRVNFVTAIANRKNMPSGVSIYLNGGLRF